MKKVFTILAVILLTATAWAQTPQKMSYQAVIRNSSDALVTNTQIGMEINIRQGSLTGTVVYTETQTPTTNANGLVSIEIGGGAGFSTINWASDNFYIETKTAVVAPLTTYTITGVSQLLSVPYALNAKTAESITGTITETDPIYTGSQAANITANDITKLSNLSGTNTGDQDLSGLATTTSVTTALNLKVDKETGKGLSTNDYTTAEQTKLAAITGINTGDQDITAMTHTNRVALDAVTGVNTGDQDLSGKVDKETGKGLSTNDYTSAEQAKLAAITGTNTGDQDITAMSHTNRVALDAVTGVNTGDQDLSGKVDKETGKGLSTEDYTTAEKTKVSNLSGVNTGDQDISGIATNATAILALQTGQTTQDAAIALNTAKIGITTQQASDITANNAKVGITTAQADAITANTAKVGYTDALVSANADVVANTAKVGITTAQVTKLNGIAAGAEVNVQANWNAASGDAQILNKPTTIAGYGITDAATKAYVDELKTEILKLKNTNTAGGSIVDVEGNYYNTVKIGTQVWMAENLKTTKYNDSTAIPNVTPDAGWVALATGAYCDYNNTPSNSTTYGKLYNFYTVVDARKLCPTGWHVPSDAEWTTLTTYLGGESVAGGKLKEIGTTHWTTPNTGATNSSGFTALAGGDRRGGAFYDAGGYGFWWSSTAISASAAWIRLLNYNGANAIRGNNSLKEGFSVRCVRD